LAGSAFKNSANVEKVKRAFTPVLVDGADPANAALVQKFGVRGFPLVVFTDKSGAEVDRVMGADVAKFESTLTRLAP
jgi:hypothetical protein